MVWIGGKKFSKKVFHYSRWKLSWDNCIFYLLGVKCSVNSEKIEDLNNYRSYWKYEKNKSMETKEIDPNRADNGY